MDYVMVWYSVNICSPAMDSTNANATFVIAVSVLASQLTRATIIFDDVR